jgi:hypothetical protein
MQTRVGEKVWNVPRHTFSVHKVLETLFYTKFGRRSRFCLKNRCSPSRFR